VRKVETSGDAAQPGHDLADLVRRYGGPLSRFLQRRVPNQADVQDVVNDVFLNIARMQDLSRIDDPERYLFRAAINALRDRQRRETTRYDSELSRAQRLDEVDFSPERLLIGRQALGALETAIRALPERTRAIFVLRALEELRIVDFARLLSLSRRAVEKHYASALVHLSRQIADHRDG
jgi:RNA polymerase sigma-70 factor (ECF subfamily)